MVPSDSGDKGGFGPSRAFSSEVETGSRQENAPNQESRSPFRINRNGAPGAAALAVQAGLPGRREKSGTALALPIEIASHAIGLWTPLG
jgi:hypothetical protein